MDTYLTLIGIVLAVSGAIVGINELRRKLAPKPYMPTSLTIIGVPMHHGRDLPGHRW